MIQLSVKINHRRFIVEFADDAPRRIMERKLIHGKLRTASYWYPRHHQSRGRNTIVQQILRAAQ